MEVFANIFFMINNFLVTNKINRCLAPPLERYRYKQQLTICNISIEPIRTFLRSKSGCPANFTSTSAYWKMLDAMMQTSR